MSTSEPGPITRTTVVEELKQDPEGMKFVHEDDKDLVTNVLFGMAHVHEDISELVLEVLDFPTYYNVTAHVLTGIIHLHDMQKFEGYNAVLVKKVYYDIQSNLYVVQILKNSVHNSALSNDIRTVGAHTLGPRLQKKRRLSSIFGLG